MPETNMSISVNGQSQVPPGFRFHPTEEELLHYYLRKKVSYEKIDLDVIRDVDLNKLEPWDIQERCKIGTTPQNDWYFFSHKDKKYPTGTRTNRATAAGFWKATGRDKVIYSNGKRIGMRKTLVFYKGRAPHGQKSDWIMHEYRLDDNVSYDVHISSNVLGEATEEGWVVCRIFKKKNHHKALDRPAEATRSKLLNEGALEQILHYMGRTCKEENDDNRFLGYQERFLKLPSLDSPNNSATSNIHPLTAENDTITDWAALDRMVASQLNGQTETSTQLACFNDPTNSFCNQPDDLNELLRSSSSSSSRSNYNSEIDLWTFTRSSSSSSMVNPLCHMSNN